MTIKTLPRHQLAEIVSHILTLEKSKYNKHLLILGFVSDDHLVLLTGTLQQIAVPLDIFKPSGTCSPDFDKFELIDYGHGVKFGEYEASADYIFKNAENWMRKGGEEWCRYCSRRMPCSVHNKDGSLAQ